MCQKYKSKVVITKRPEETVSTRTQRTTNNARKYEEQEVLTWNCKKKVIF
jgi:hypothetical protein